MKRLRHSWLLLLVLLTACRGMSNPGSTCTSFTALQGKVGEVSNLNAFGDWIGEHYALKKPSDLEIEVFSDLNASFSWQVDGYEYSAYVEDGEFRRLDISKKGSGTIRASDMIACFGTPEFYRATHELAINGSNAQSFDLYFPSAGVIAHGYRNYSSGAYSTSPIKDNFPILYFVVTQPGTVDEMLTFAFGSAYPYEFGAIRSWPSDWEDIVIDVSPKIQELRDHP